jgi:hypothetical protein
MKIFVNGRALHETVTDDVYNFRFLRCSFFWGRFGDSEIRTKIGDPPNKDREKREVNF